MDLITERLGGALKKPLPAAMVRSIELAKKHTADIPPRQGSFCIGCPHRATLYSVVKATDRKVIFAGDIGCYTLSCLPPFSAFDWVTCMNCGVGIGQGMLSTLEGEDMLAYVGDSTFFHSGIQGLINAVQQDANMVLVILDNKWVAMTGHQPSPTTDTAVDGTKLNPVDIKGLLKSIGVKYVRTVDPFNIKATTSAIKDALRKKEGVRVIISEAECALQYGRTAQVREARLRGPLPDRARHLPEVRRVLRASSVARRSGAKNRAERITTTSRKRPASTAAPATTSAPTRPSPAWR